MTTPDGTSVTPHILKLARQIDPTGTLTCVSVSPQSACLPGAPFENVQLVVEKQGGSVQHGWRMREQPDAFAEGAFHAVWRSPDGTLIDVTPKEDHQTEILFLPDSQAVWEGEPVDPRRLMLHAKPCYCGSGLPFRICHSLAED